MSGSALKALRADLTAHLATGLSASAPLLGQLVHPPAVQVEAGNPYVEAAPGYCNDGLLFQATVFAPPGDLAAVVDALDDMIDEVRSTLRNPSTSGHQYKFVQVSGYTPAPADDKTLPSVVVDIGIERPSP